MVIEVAGADIHFIGNVIGGDVGFAEFVEQLQAGVEDAIAGFHSGETWPWRKERPTSYRIRSVFWQATTTVVDQQAQIVKR
jgi:hypothetical protein